MGHGHTPAWGRKRIPQDSYELNSPRDCIFLKTVFVIKDYRCHATIKHSLPAIFICNDFAKGELFVKMLMDPKKYDLDVQGIKVERNKVIYRRKK